MRLTTAPDYTRPTPCRDCGSIVVETTARAGYTYLANVKRGAGYGAHRCAMREQGEQYRRECDAHIMAMMEDDSPGYPTEHDDDDDDDSPAWTADMALAFAAMGPRRRPFGFIG